MSFLASSTLRRTSGDRPTHTIRYLSGHDAGAPAAPLDPKDFLARVVMHIPDPRRHVIRYYGTYSNVVRARRRREAATTATAPTVAPPVAVAHVPTDPEWRAGRRRWAALIRRIYEVDPLVCPRCGATMGAARRTHLAISHLPPDATGTLAGLTSARRRSHARQACRVALPAPFSRTQALHHAGHAPQARCSGRSGGR
jgi:hypothetical protein